MSKYFFRSLHSFNSGQNSIIKWRHSSCKTIWTVWIQCEIGSNEPKNRILKTLCKKEHPMTCTSTYFTIWWADIIKLKHLFKIYSYSAFQGNLKWSLKSNLMVTWDFTAFYMIWIYNFTGDSWLIFWIEQGVNLGLSERYFRWRKDQRRLWKEND